MIFTERQKRLAAIHDISGFGKCSLTVALPVLSCAGFEVTALPTAVLSTHTAVPGQISCRDLTDDMPSFLRHWADLKLTFDSIYSGYLGSERQIDTVCRFIDRFRSDSTLVVVDPAMADNGKMYSLFDRSFAKKMLPLCKKADIIVPNMTEALFLLGKEYVHSPYTKEFIEDLLLELEQVTCQKIVLTGVCLDDTSVGAACLENSVISYVFAEKVNGVYHGTGDVFASALTAALLKEKDLTTAADIAVNFTVDSIKRTAAGATDHRYGVDFERGLPKLIETLG